jgi:hypothetical protein
MLFLASFQSRSFESDAKVLIPVETAKRLAKFFCCSEDIDGILRAQNFVKGAV